MSPDCSRGVPQRDAADGLSSMVMRGNGRAASLIVTGTSPVQEIPGLMEGTGKPDYANAVTICTKAATEGDGRAVADGDHRPDSRRPGAGRRGRGRGSWSAVWAAGFCLAIFSANAGGAWDNAKKYIERGHYGGQGLTGAQGGSCPVIRSAIRSRMLPVRRSTSCLSFQSMVSICRAGLVLESLVLPAVA